MLLFPAAVVVIFVLAGLAADTAVAWNARRQVSDVAATVANDAVTALVERDFYGGGRVAYDVEEAVGRAAAAIAARTEGSRADHVGLRITCDRPTVTGTSVSVVCHGRARTLFWRAGWLGRDHWDVSAGATATAVER